MSQAATGQIAEVHYDPDCPPEQIKGVLFALDRWSGRTAKHVTHQRSSSRHNYRSTVVIEPSPDEGTSVPSCVFHVPTRNVSKSGLGFVAPPVFIPRVLSDAAPLVRSEALFRVGMTIKLTLGSAEATILPVVGEIVRIRPVHHGFLEIGVRFHDRADAVEAPANQGTTSCVSS